MSSQRIRNAVATLVVAAFFFTLGCSEEKPTPTASRLAAIGKLYQQFRSENRGRVPNDEAEFRQFVESQGDWVLEEAQAGSFDEMFISERDEKPLVLMYGKSRKWLNDMQVAVHETTGADGQVMVGYMSGDSELVYEEAFKKMK